MAQWICYVLGVLSMLTCYYLVNSYRRNRKMNPYKKDLHGKIVVITGCSAGLGKKTATEFAKMGAKLYCLNRDKTKSEKVLAEIREEVPDAQLEHITCDVSDLDSVVKAADELIKKVPCVDLLVNNAGIMGGPVRESPQGFELQYATNFLGHFLLTHKLMNKLKSAKDSSRVVFLTSMGHLFVMWLKWKSLFFKNITHHDGAAGMVYYSWSKYFCLLAARAMQERFGDDKVSFYAVAPGVIDTNLFQHVRGFFALFFRTRIMTKSVEEGAQTTLYCCTAPENKLEKGAYYDHCGIGTRGIYAWLFEDKNKGEVYDVAMEHIKKYL